MKWENSSIVTGDLFLDLESVVHGKTAPSLQTVLNLNEIVELVVLKDKLLMPSTDHIMILKNLNRQEIQELGGHSAVDWEHEIESLGTASLKEPVIANALFREGVLILDTEQTEDEGFRDLGQLLFSRQWNGDWMLRDVGLGEQERGAKHAIELRYVDTFNATFEDIADPLYWKMAILAAPDLAPDLQRRTGYDYSWTYRFYKEVELYADFARERGIGLSDSSLAQPFVCLNCQPSQRWIDVFYSRLKGTRDEQIRQFLKVQEPWVLSLPPLTAILLQRCDRLDRLPDEMIILRLEFSDLRESLAEYERECEQAETLREKLEAAKRFDSSLKRFVERVRQPRKRILKTIIDFAVGQSDSLVRKDFAGPAAVIARSLADYMHERKLYPWMNSFLHLYDTSLDIRLHPNLYERLFGPLNFADWHRFERFARNSHKLLDVHSRQLAES